MKKLLNTLYVTSPDAYLSKEGNDVVVTMKQQGNVVKIPIINLQSIITFGYLGASPGLIQLCAQNKVALSFLTPSGKFIARIQGPISGNVLLRNTQFHWAESEEQSLHVASIMIAGKIQNQRSILKRFERDYGENPEIETVCNALSNAKKKALKVTDKDTLRGIEGDSSNAYFSVFNNLLLNQKNDFVFNERNRRPPKDPINAMLSFSYTLLAHDCASALESVGLDPCVGFLHTLRPGRASLALDVMEEFRAYLCDRLIFSLINKKQVTIKGFVKQGDDSVTMTDDCRKTIISAWQNRKKEEIIHPYLQEKIQIGLLPYAQSMLLARFMRGDLDDYPVFIIK